MTTLLVTDDDPALRMTVAANLEEAGYTVLEAEDGLQALEVVAAHPEVELVLTDIRMPRLDGVEAYRRLKAARPALPVVMMTAFAREQQILDAMAQGVFAVVIKPFDTDVLLRVVERALEHPWVLVIDDDPATRDALEQGLVACHCAALARADARAALAALDEVAVDIAVIDLVMPDPDGLETARQLRRARPHLGVVMMTGHDVPDMIRAAAAEGAISVLSKPFDVRDLVRIVAEQRGRGRD